MIVGIFSAGLPLRPLLTKLLAVSFNDSTNGVDAGPLALASGV